MIKKFIFLISILLLSLVSINFISADVSNTIISCGGDYDGSVVIGCLDYPTLTFLGSLPSVPISPGGGGGGPEQANISENITIQPTISNVIDLTPYIFIGLLLVLFFFIFLIWKRKKRKCKLKLFGYDDDDDKKKK